LISRAHRGGSRLAQAELAQDAERAVPGLGELARTGFDTLLDRGSKPTCARARSRPASGARRDDRARSRLDDGDRHELPLGV
jgi:hypothetical protein